MTVLTVSLANSRGNVLLSLRGNVILGEATSVRVERISQVDIAPMKRLLGGYKNTLAAVT
jgi:hypothetical protein